MPMVLLHRKIATTRMRGFGPVSWAILLASLVSGLAL
jgi:hypothetical protein